MNVSIDNQVSVSIVVLNYLNYKDTIECVDSALAQNYKIKRIIVIDNGSHNESARILKKYYNKNSRVKIIILEKNLGFAKGNNVGICYARKELKSSFVLVVNNDTKFIDPNYINILISNYEYDVGVIGSQILLADGRVHDTNQSTLELRQCLMNYLNLFSLCKGSSFDFPVDNSNGAKILHGCALLFTPSYFRYFDGFYPRTFLYHEEEILYLMCRYKNLRQKYVSSTQIFHKEDQSSKLSFGNETFIKKQYQYSSYKYVLFWIIKCRLLRREI